MSEHDDALLQETFTPLGDVDPDGLSPKDAGAKLDSGKPRLGLVLNGFARALTAVSEVGTMGANKYCDNGWMEVKNGGRRYTDAMYRHFFAEVSDGDFDPESGLLHAAHAAWNALARLELKIRKEEQSHE